MEICVYNLRMDDLGPTTSPVLHNHLPLHYEIIKEHQQW